MLNELFAHQAELNRRVGFDAESLRKRFDPQLAGEWLNNYIMAASNELEELRDCTFWKHWCAEARNGQRFRLHDLQNARVEVIDLLFFWISMAQCVGLDADGVMELYRQKLRVNHNRQNTGYSMKDKTEADNRAIALGKRPRTRKAAESAKRVGPAAFRAESNGRSADRTTATPGRPRGRTSARSPSRAVASTRRR